MRDEKTNTLKIHTPEGVVFSLRLAGPVTRFLAWVIDFACILTATMVLGKILNILAMFSADIAYAVSVLSYFAVSIGYSIVLEWYWNGQTVGKRLTRLRVMDAQGLHLKFSQIVMRNLLRFVDGLPMFYLVGGVAVLISKRAQRIGDLASNTIVIRSPETTEPDFAQIVSDKFNSFRTYPHLAARLRQNTGPAEADVALQALLRRNELAPESRIQLFKKVADHFRSTVDFPQEATEGLSDENYIRNVVDILFRPSDRGNLNSVQESSK